MIQEKKEAITDKIPNRKRQQTQQVEKAVYEMKKKLVYHILFKLNAPKF